MRPLLRARLRVLGLSVTAAGYLSHWLAPGKKCATDPQVVLETWDAVADGTHNCNTDLIYWRDAYYLAHHSAPYHLGSRRSRMLLWRWPDARAGDTCYGGIAIRGDEAFASYYTSPVKSDLPWVMGMLRPTDIRMARISLPAMERLAMTKAQR